MKRRDFLRLSAGLAGLAPLAQACSPPRKIPGSIIGASAATGHLLRDHTFGEPDQFEEREVVIVGGGISGLSAARHLSRNGISGITLLDLEARTGGNAACGHNAVSGYPWGAHYIPLPNNNLTEYLVFLEECGVITGWDDKGLPLYNEYHLCQDPEERLYINGRWQEGLVPHFGLPERELQQFRNFLAKMQEYRSMKGRDGKDAFAIPVDHSSRDATLTALDTLTMKQWMVQQQLDSPYIHWYVNYCTRDDFGTPYDQISAWAGIHYFAARKGQAGNAAYQDVLTWEQGNGFLAAKLQQQSEAQIQNKALVVAVKITEGGVDVHYYEVAERRLKGIRARHCIMAVPQFVAARLLQDGTRLEQVHEHLHYAPWMVANITVGQLAERDGAPPSWDNVIYGSTSLGYVDATHQQVQQRKDKRNLTFYLPLTEAAPAAARKKAYETSHEEWVARIVQELNIIHPGVDAAIEKVDIMLWGHAMAQPLPGIIHGGIRERLATSIAGRIHFAHTDLAGISIFEEAFYQGIKAANAITGS